VRTCGAWTRLDTADPAWAAHPEVSPLQEWVHAATALVENIYDTTGLPVFVQGCGVGAAAAYGALQELNALAGAILMSPAIPSSPGLPSANPFRSTQYDLLTELWSEHVLLHVENLADFDEASCDADPLRATVYHMTAFASILRYQPAVLIEHNTKPILFAIPSHDPLYGIRPTRRLADRGARRDPRVSTISAAAHARRLTSTQRNCPGIVLVPDRQPSTCRTVAQTVTFQSIPSCLVFQ
jgi:hypothetical protein